MAKMLESYCTKALGEYADYGFRAFETDDHFLVVEHYGKEIARYNATTVSFDEVKKDCCQHYNEDVLLGHALEGQQNVCLYAIRTGTMDSGFLLA